MFQRIKKYFRHSLNFDASSSIFVVVKKFAVILITALLLAPFMAKMFFTTAFYLNQSTIARELCVQRNISNNTCKGTCYLKNKLDKLDDSAGTEHSRSEKSSDEKVFFTSASSPILDSHEPFISLTFFDTYINSPASADLADVFHPPSL